MTAERRTGLPLRGYLPMLGGQATALLGGFLISVILVHAIGADGRGIVALLTTATVVAASIASSGLEGAMARESGAGSADAGRMALWWSLRVGIVVTGIWAAIAALAGDFWRLDPWSAAGLAALGMAVVFTTSLLRGVLLGSGRYREVGTGRAVSALLGVLGVLILALAGVLTAQLAIGVGFAATVAQGLVYWRAAGVRAGPTMERRARARHRSHAIRSSPGIFFLSIQSRVDLLIVGAFLSTAETGIYAVLLTLSELAWVPIDVAALMVLGSAAGGRHSLQDAARASRVVALLASVIALALALSGPVVLALAFGREFADEWLALMLLLPGSVALAVWRFTTNDAAGRGQPEMASFSAGVGGSVAVVAALILVPSFGLQGAAAASTIAYLTTAVVGTLAYSRRYGTPVAELVRPRRSDLKHHTA